MPRVMVHHALGEKELQDLVEARFSETTLVDLKNRPGFDDALRSLLVKLHAALPYTRVAVLAKTYEGDEVIPKLPVVLLARLRLSLIREAGSDFEQDYSLTIGSIGTDHVGYASFDLRPLRSLDVLLALAAQYPEGTTAENLQLKAEYFLLPFGESQRAIDLLRDADVGFDTIVLRLHVEQGWLADREPDPSLPAMQNPSIADWRLSPGSFALAPARLVGDGDCADLYPSDLSSYTFRFHNLVRLGETVSLERPIVLSISQKREHPKVKSVGFGYVAHYRSDWFPIGHSLGRVLYSLPLAPGEKVNLAIVDWRRNDDAFRDETTSVSEELEHETQRDRVVGEIVRASIKEKQSGHSLMGGLGGSAVGTIGGAIVGGSLGLGAAKRSSGGTRNVVASTIQGISDGFDQSSTAFRELRSTVVTRASQVEGGRVETRRIANFNHCHTLTILYYEVLRHYRTETVYTGRQPVLYLDFEDLNGPFFLNEEDWILANRLALENALLDGRYAAGFDALGRVRAARQRLELEQERAEEAQDPGAARWEFSRFMVVFHTGAKGHDGPVRFQLVKRDGSIVTCRQVQPAPVGGGDFLQTADHPDFDENSIDAFAVVPEQAVRWQDLQNVQVQLHEHPIPFADKPQWTINAIEVFATTSSGRTTKLVDHSQVIEMIAPDSAGVLVTAPSGEEHSFTAALTDFVSEADIEAARQLQQHLDAFGRYYSMVLLMSGDPVARSYLLDNLELAGSPISDLVENRVIDFDGRSLVLPLHDDLSEDIRRLFGNPDDDIGSSILIENLVSVPTRGIFADGKQGHCNTCEKIDDSRFWDFQTSPIPGDAPAIAPVSTDSRFQAAAGITPTDFPANIVNVQSPSALPDPTAIAAALKVLGTPDIFRDLSGGKDLADFLTKVVEGSQELVSSFAQQKAKEDLLKAVDGLKNVSDADKGAIAKEIVKATSGKAGGSASSQSQDKKGNSTPAGEGKPGSNSTGSAPSVTSEKRLEKPVRPSETDIDGYTVRVFGKSQEPKMTMVRAITTIHPDGQSPTQPVPITEIPSQDIRMPKNASRSGKATARFEVIPIPHVWETFVVSPETILPRDDERVLAIEEFFYSRNAERQLSVDYQLPATSNVVELQISIKMEYKFFEADTMDEAYALLNAEVGEAFWVFYVSVVPPNPEGETEKKTWTFLYGKESEAIEFKKI